jgi:type IV secretory pathway TrbD component
LVGGIGKTAAQGTALAAIVIGLELGLPLGLVMIPAWLMTKYFLSIMYKNDSQILDVYERHYKYMPYFFASGAWEGAAGYKQREKAALGDTVLSGVLSLIGNNKKNKGD